MSAPVCPTPEKHAYDSAGEAQRSIAMRFREGEEQQAYRCRCRRWHVGDPRRRPARRKDQRRWKRSQRAGRRIFGRSK